MDDLDEIVTMVQLAPSEWSWVLPTLVYSNTRVVDAFDGPSSTYMVAHPRYGVFACGRFLARRIGRWTSSHTEPLVEAPVPSLRERRRLCVALRHGSATGAFGNVLFDRPFTDVSQLCARAISAGVRCSHRNLLSLVAARLTTSPLLIGLHAVWVAIAVGAVGRLVDVTRHL